PDLHRPLNRSRSRGAQKGPMRTNPMRNAECGMRNPVSRNTQHATRTTDHAPRSTLHAPRFCRAFTMIEIAISLAIIGFALVAIIGVLPIGMNVQKDNREETIINQDATVMMDAIRNCAQGLDDLTNYVIAITNTVTQYSYPKMNVIFKATYGYTRTNSSGMALQFPLTNGFRIVGL